MLHHEFDQLMSAEVDELVQLTANRDRLQHEQERLLQAHYADAIPLACSNENKTASWANSTKSTGASTPTTASTPTPEPTSTTP